MKKYLPYAQAAAIAEKVVAALRPHCTRIEIAGSLRRSSPHVGDLDLVVQDPTDAFFHRAQEHARQTGFGQLNVSFEMLNLFCIEVYIARTPALDLFCKPEGAPFGTLLLCRTGSRHHNIWIAERALSMGFRWSPYRGLLDGDTLLTHDEAEIYRYLRLPYLPPEIRSLPIAKIERLIPDLLRKEPARA